MERDDIYEYSLDTHHNEEQGKEVRKKIYLVTLILSVITAVEVLMGMFIKNDGSMMWNTIKWLFIILTIVKAGYIVMVFMHLKDENKTFRYFILVPYFIFMAYLTVMVLAEGYSVGNSFATYGA